jgi:copper resistance protein C
MKFASCLILVLWVTPAFANAHLVRSTPANGASVRSPAHILLRFSEALEPAFSGALLLDEDGHNMTGDPVKVDGTAMRLSPGTLAPGKYIVSWEARGHEGRTASGHFHFTVR